MFGVPIFVIVMIGVILFTNLFVLACTQIIGRKFDKLLREKNIPYPFVASIFLPDFIGRAGKYCACLTFRNIKKDNRPLMEYMAFDFRKYASKLDFILSYSIIILYIISFGLLFAFFVLYK